MPVTGNTKNFGADLLETLLKMAPTKEEEIKLRDFKEETSPIKIGPAEKFLKAVLDVPFAFKRVDAMLYIANFESEVNYLKNNFDTLEVSYGFPGLPRKVSRSCKMTEDNLNMAYWCAKQVIVLNFCENYVICVKLCYLCQNYVICENYVICVETMLFVSKLCYVYENEAL